MTLHADIATPHRTPQVLVDQLRIQGVDPRLLRAGRILSAGAGRAA